MTLISTGYVVYISKDGELPTVLAYEPTEAAATAEALEIAKDFEIDPDDVPAPKHVECHSDRDRFDVKHWLLFGRPYSPDGDVTVPYGTTLAP
jgi:hypothetical protein